MPSSNADLQFFINAVTEQMPSVADADASDRPSLHRGKVRKQVPRVSRRAFLSMNLMIVPAWFVRSCRQ